MQRTIIIIGLIIVIIGLCWPWLSKIPLGRLPGDINIKKDGFSFSFPVMTCILISIILSIAMWITKR